MKKILTLILVSLLFHAAVNAQEEKKEHQHTGFYLSMGLGPAFGKVKVSNLDIKNTGAAFDFKIGGAVKENLILHATILSNALIKPQDFHSDELLVSETMLGGGFTYYYFMPENLFISASLGSGKFTVENQKTKQSVSSDEGLAFQIKTGQEWWVSRKWGLGVAIAYNHTNVKNAVTPEVNEILKSNRFSIMFSATLN